MHIHFLLSEQRLAISYPQHRGSPGTLMGACQPLSSHHCPKNASLQPPSPAIQAFPPSISAPLKYLHRSPSCLMEILSGRGFEIEKEESIGPGLMGTGRSSFHWVKRGSVLGRGLPSLRVWQTEWRCQGRGHCCPGAWILILRAALPAWSQLP